MKTLPREPFRGGQICGEQLEYGVVGGRMVFCGERKAQDSYWCAVHDAEMREQYETLPKVAPGNAWGDEQEPVLLQWEPMDEDPAPVDPSAEELAAYGQAYIAVHDHFSSTVDAYDETQWNEEIRSGDVLVIKSEGVVGILDQAWPAAITVAHGELHTWNRSGHLVRDGDYRVSLAVALGKARELDFAINPLHAPVITAPEPEPGPAPEPGSEDAYYDGLCPWCDGYGLIEIFHPSTDALIGHERCTNRDYHKVSLVKPPKPETFRHLPGCDGDRNVRAECCPPF